MKDFSTRHNIIRVIQNIDIIGIRFLGNLLPQILIPKAKSKVVIKTIHDFALLVDPIIDNGVEKSIYYTGSYERGTLHIINEILKPGDTFIDVGANIGLMSIFSAKKVGSNGQVHSFEPNPNTREILEKNIELNNINNIRVHKSGISNENKTTLIFDRLKENRGSSSLIAPDYPTNSYEITITTLDDIFEANIDIHLIKIDIEGFEIEALEGATNILNRDNPPALIVECSIERSSSQDFSKKRLFEFLTKNGKYGIYKLSGNKKRTSKLKKITAFNDLPNHDNIFCFTEGRIKNLSQGIFLDQH